MALMDIWALQEYDGNPDGDVWIPIENNFGQYRIQVKDLLAFIAAGGSLVSLPITPNYPASGVEPVDGVFSTVGTGESPEFTPIAGRPFNVTLWGTFSGTVTLQRYFGDGTGGWFDLTINGSPWGVYSAPVSEQAWEEAETGVRFRLAFDLASGAVQYRISQ